MTDFCGRCLVIADATSVVDAEWRDHDGIRLEHVRNITHPRSLAAWAENIMTRSGGDAKFRINTMAECLTPFATWHGDPVCAYHLWVLVEADRHRNGYW